MPSGRWQPASATTEKYILVALAYTRVMPKSNRLLLQYDRGPRKKSAPAATAGWSDPFLADNEDSDRRAAASTARHPAGNSRTDLFCYPLLGSR